MRRALAVLLLLLAAGVPAAGGAPGADLSLTFSVQVEFGGGTGTVASPVALCDTGADGKALRRISDRTGLYIAPAWSRDGSKLAFETYDSAKRRFLLQVTPASSWKPVTVARSTARLDRPTWSADGARIAYGSTSKAAPGIYSVRVDGTGNKRLYAGAASGPSWSPDGTRIVFTTSGGISVMGSDGSNVQTVSADGIEPAWSSDGSKILFVATVGQFLDQDVFTIGPDGSGRTRLSHLSPSTNGGTTYVGVPAAAPDGSTIAVLHTVERNFGKGSYFERHLVFLDPVSGAATSVDLPLAFGDPAWRAAPPPTAQDVVTRPCAILAGDGGVTVKGTAYDDLIVTGNGSDAVDGGAGNDWIETATGNDRVTGGPGRDEIWSGPGIDSELVRDGERDIVHCGDFRRDVVQADRRDLVLGRCKTIKRG